MSTEPNQKVENQGCAPPDVTSPSPQDSKIVTILDAKKRYRKSREDVSGFRDLVAFLIDSGFEKPFQNDSYFDALVLTEAMFERSKHNIRWLTGSGTDGFISELFESFVSALDRIQAAGGTVRLIILSNQLPPKLCDLAKKYSGTLKIALAKPLSNLQHFIICDSKIVRIEQYHKDLSDATSAHEIKAEVFFNNSEKGRMLDSYFDAMWTSVMPVK